MTDIHSNGFAIPDIEPLTRKQQFELGEGLTIVSAPQFECAAGLLLLMYESDIEENFPSDSGAARFLNPHQFTTATSTLEAVGENLLGSLGNTGIKRRRSQGDIMEAFGMIFYPPDNPGYGPHSDSSLYSGFGRMARLTLSISGVGNHTARTTGERLVAAGNLMIQDLSRGVVHGMDTVARNQRRVAAFWDLPIE